jgi:hypothetical protein
VIWRLGGKKSDFQMGPGTRFAWQHDARPHDGGLLSLFDDGAAPKVQPESRGLLLAVDPADNEGNYRGLRFPWVGRPLDRPRLALAPTGLYVSWNGATEVRAWELRSGPTADRGQTSARRPRAGFETAFPLPAGARSAIAVALDGDGRPLAESNTVAL